MLEQLPDRVSAVESQVLQLRVEMRVEFSAVRADMRDLHTRAIHHADGLNAQTIRVVETLHTETNRRMDELIADTRRHMLILHEEIIDRLKRLDEGRG